MTREDHLCFCCVCSNRKFTHEFGFICGLTNQKADFEDTCPNFIRDIEERSKRNQELRNDIDESINRQKTWVNKMLDDKPKLNYLVSEFERISKVKNEEVIVVESKTKKAKVLVSALGLIAVAIYFVISDEVTFQNLGSVVSVLFLFLFGVFLLPQFFSREELVRLNKLGVIINKKQFIPWYQLRFVYFKASKARNEIVNHLVFVREFGDNIEVDLEYSNLEQKQLGSSIFEYLKAYKKN